MHRIYVSRSDDGWIADFRDAADADAIRSQFGTAILPTAFTAVASFGTVYERLSILNPAHEIIRVSDVRR
jgi:hypothetical protein